jgi:hypothetical protein
MSYQEKYFKYKNKYLDLKSKLSKMQVNNLSEESSVFLNPKDINLVGGKKKESEIEINQLSSDTISSLFNQNGGGRTREKKVNVKSKQMKASKQFIQDNSDSDLVSSNTISNSDSDFLSSEVDF